MSIERAELEQRTSESTSAEPAIAMCSFKDNALFQFSRSRYGQCPIQCGARNFEQIGYALAVVFAFLNQFAGMVELLRGEFALSSEFNPTALGRFDPGASTFADKAALKLGQEANQLPHGATSRRVGVYVFCKRTEFNAALFEFVEHCYQVVQATAQSVELPHYERVAGFELLQTAEQGGALRGRA
jgi:hypothetical protein